MEDMEAMKKVAEQSRDVREIVAYVRNMTRKLAIDLEDQKEAKAHEEYVLVKTKFNNLANWGLIEGSVAEAKRHQLVGTGLPMMAETRGFKRLIVRLVAQAVVRVSQIFLRSQRAYNVANANAIEQIMMICMEYQKILSSHEQRIFELEKKLWEQSQKLDQARHRFANIQCDVTSDILKIEKDFEDFKRKVLAQ